MGFKISCSSQYRAFLGNKYNKIYNKDNYVGGEKAGQKGHKPLRIRLLCTCIHHRGGQKYEDTENPRKSKPPTVATERWEILDASMLPPTTAREVQMVCPIVAPTATPIAFLWVASCRRKIKGHKKCRRKKATNAADNKLRQNQIVKAENVD